MSRSRLSIVDTVSIRSYAMRPSRDDDTAVNDDVDVSIRSYAMRPSRVDRYEKDAQASDSFNSLVCDEALASAAETR